MQTEDKRAVERDRFSIGATFLMKLYDAFKRLSEDLALEEKGFSQLGIVDYSELYRFMHPDYVRDHRRDLLAITHLLLVDPVKIQTKLYLIDPYLAELIAHMNKISQKLNPAELEKLIASPEVAEFLAIMKREDPTPYLARLNVLFSYLRSNFLTLLVPGAETKDIEGPMKDLLRLFSEEKLHMWKEPMPNPQASDLMGTRTYKDIKARLDLYRDRLEIPNKTDALAAAFIHSVSRTLFDQGKYAVIYSGSSIPIFEFQAHDFMYEHYRLPIARDLYYALSRISLFQKFGSRVSVINVLDQVMPHMKNIAENIDEIKVYVDLTLKIETVPDKLREGVKKAAASWEVVCDRLYNEISEVLARVSADTLKDWRRTVFKEPCPVSLEECRDVRDAIADSGKRTENAQKIVDTIGIMLEKLSAVTKTKK